MADDEDDQLDPATHDALAAAIDAIPSAADPVLTAKQQRSKRDYAHLREAFWKAVLADPVGRQEIWAILGFEAHAFEVKLACGPNGAPQPEATWLALGEQMLGQRIFQTLQIVDFEGAYLMLSEHDGRFKKPAKGRK